MKVDTSLIYMLINAIESLVPYFAPSRTTTDLLMYDAPANGYWYLDERGGGGFYSLVLAEQASTIPGPRSRWSWLSRRMEICMLIGTAAVGFGMSRN